MKVKVTQSCPTLCDPINCTVHGILQARITGAGSCSLLQGTFPTQEPKHIVKKLPCPEKSIIVTQRFLWVTMEQFMKLILMAKTGCLLVVSQ